MKVQPIASPHAMQTPQSNSQSAARAKAIAMISGGDAAPATPQAPPPQREAVANPNQVSPEELSAIQPRQTDNTESSQEVTPPEIDPTPAPKQEDPALSRQFAQLAKQEKALRAKAQAQDQQFRDRMAQLEAREAQFKQQQQPTTPDPKSYYTKDQIQQNALQVLQDAGISYEQITQQVMNPMDSRVQTMVQQMQAEIQALKSEREADKKSYETKAQESQQAQYQAAVNQITLDVKALVASEPEKFEAISKTGTVREVVKLIEDTYNKDKILLSVEQAAQKVEDYLVEENFNMFNRINKIKQRVQKVAPTEASSTAQTPAASTPKQPQPMKTLTNASSSGRQLSAKERAILAFKGELSKG